MATSQVRADEETAKMSSGLLSTPLASSSNHNVIANIPPPTPSELKAHLQTLLEAKERQLLQAGTLGQRVLAQQMELEERIRKIQSLTPGLEAEAYGYDPQDEDVYGGIASNNGRNEPSNDDFVEGEALDQYRELAQAVAQWEEENRTLSGELGASVGGNISLTVRRSLFAFLEPLFNDV